jgi:hypothetical protein
MAGVMRSVDNQDLLDELTQLVLEPIYSGSLQSRGVKCGKARCKCTRGQLHQSTYLILSHGYRKVQSRIRVHKLQIPEVKEGIARRRRILEILGLLTNDSLRKLVEG